MRVQEPNLALQAQFNNRQVSAASLRSVSAQNSPVSAVQPISRQLDKFVSGLQGNTKISPQIKKSMIDIAALTDAFVNNPSARNSVFKDLAGAAVFIGKSSTLSFPNYPTLTGLRYYDTLRTEALATPTTGVEDLYAQLETVVQNAAGVTMADVAKFIEGNPQAAREVMEMVGVETVVDDFGTAEQTSNNEAESQTSSPQPTTNIEV